MRRTRRRHRRRNPSASAYTTHWKRASSRGKKLLRRFWGIRSAPTIKLIEGKLPGIRKNATLVSLGMSPAVTLADGPETNHTKIVRVKHHGQLVSDERGKRMFILTGKTPGGRLKFAGFAPTTEYVPLPGIESAGSPKRGKHWVHSHGSKEAKGAKWPRVFKDKNGNYIYAKGTYRVSGWIYK